MRENLFTFLAPGFILIIGGALLVRVAEAVAIPLIILGVLVLIGWPITAIIVDVRVTRQQKHDQPISSGLARAHSFTEAVSAITMIFVIPSAVLGGLGIFCLVTAADDPEDTMFKTIVGFGALLLLVGYLSIFAFGRSKTVLRFIGMAVLIFGVICLVGATQEFIVGEAGRRSGAGLIGGLLMSIAGLWLTITGRTTWSRNTQTGGQRPLWQRVEGDNEK
ncbi:hypothetical protein [Brevibacterium spongiae]|uniref:DUF308 domain-containing protein n=1 Tax=Brevibacterium spongiae TaxID=2909672 RepID=A0ABY5SL46_9MICO|nr:hypothetical protein [Brevibacterium spongiae]UVI35247.1 hypothetical protein L1F31_14135 [Brevibacterium spongiae]